MANERFYRGDLAILYIEFGGIFKPVACLTENNISESAEVLDTTTIDNGGWATSIPTNQSYTVGFSGIATPDLGVENTKLSLYTLRSIKRARTVFNWEIRTNSTEFVDSGTGFLSEISDGASVGEFVTFSGTIIGYGRPFQSGGATSKVTWDSDIVTFDSTAITWDNDDEIPAGTITLASVVQGLLNAFTLTYTIDFAVDVLTVISTGTLSGEYTHEITGLGSPVDVTHPALVSETIYFKIVGQPSSGEFDVDSNQVAVAPTGTETVTITNVIDIGSDFYEIYYTVNFAFTYLEAEADSTLTGTTTKDITNEASPAVMKHILVGPEAINFQIDATQLGSGDIYSSNVFNLPA